MPSPLVTVPSFAHDLLTCKTLNPLKRERDGAWVDLIISMMYLYVAYVKFCTQDWNALSAISACSMRLTPQFQCLQLSGFVRGFPELCFGKRTTDIDRIITEIDYHEYDEQDG